MSNLKAVPDKKRALFKAPEGVTLGVDREAKIVRGYVMVQEGPFFSEGRGEFDKDAIRELARLAGRAPGGLKSRFTHPGLSSDGLGTFLGRAKNARVETGEREMADGRRAAIDFVRADLHLAESSFTSPRGNLGEYVLRLAEEDPGAFSSSIVVQADEEWRTDEKDRPLKGQDGKTLPPLWRPKRLFASDIVDEGDAVHGGLLSVPESIDLDGLPDALVRQAWALLDRQFKGAERGVIEQRCRAFLGRYLESRFGPAPPEGGSAPPGPSPALDEALARRLRRMNFVAEGLRKGGA